MRGVEPRSEKETTILSTRLAYVYCRPMLPVSGPQRSKPQLTALCARQRTSAVPYSNNAEYCVVGPQSRQMALTQPSQKIECCPLFRTVPLISRRACYVLKLPPRSPSKPVHAQVKIVYHVFLRIARGNFPLFPRIHKKKRDVIVAFFFFTVLWRGILEASDPWGSRRTPRGALPLL